MWDDVTTIGLSYFSRGVEAGREAWSRYVKIAKTQIDPMSPIMFRLGEN